MSVIALSRARIGDAPEILETIHDGDVALAIWERDMPAALSHLLSRRTESVSFASTLAMLPQTLAASLDSAGYLRHGARILLETDITALASRFAHVMGIDAVDLRLDRITTNACRKFHADYVKARLITTYAGSGTQWLSEAVPPGSEPSDLRNIRQLRAGDVAIFRGWNWSEASAAIHRSPPIEGTGEERLVLVINPSRAMPD